MPNHTQAPSRPLAAIAAACLALIATAACAPRAVQTEAGGAVMTSASAMPMAERSMDQMVADWPMKQREAATQMSAKYGQPDVMSDRLIVWMNRTPYAKIALMRDEVQHDFPVAHTDFLTHTVMHEVRADMVDELAEYDGSVWAHRTRGELSAQCDTEEHNNIALNLAHEVMMGRRAVQDARMMYARVVMELMQGKTSPYASGLMFQTMPNAADPDTVVRATGM